MKKFFSVIKGSESYYQHSFLQSKTWWEGDSDLITDVELPSYYLDNHGLSIDVKDFVMKEAYHVSELYDLDVDAILKSENVDLGALPEGCTGYNVYRNGNLVRSVTFQLPSIETVVFFSDLRSPFDPEEDTYNDGQTFKLDIPEDSPYLRFDEVRSINGQLLKFKKTQLVSGFAEYVDQTLYQLANLLKYVSPEGNTGTLLTGLIVPEKYLK